MSDLMFCFRVFTENIGPITGAKFKKATVSAHQVAQEVFSTSRKYYKGVGVCHICLVHLSMFHMLVLVT